jgi:hypothetical protein
MLIQQNSWNRAGQCQSMAYINIIYHTIDIMKPVDTQEVIISDPSSLFYLIEPQWPLSNEKAKHKFWHFKFVKDETEAQFTDVLEKLGKNITVTYNYVGQDKPDVSLTENGELIGKIQFIHFDRRDRKNTSKHYIKLYFIKFDANLVEKAKTSVVQFFDDKRNKKGIYLDEKAPKEEPKEEPKELKEEPKELKEEPKELKEEPQELKEEPKELKEPKEEPKELKEPRLKRKSPKRQSRLSHRRLTSKSVKKHIVKPYVKPVINNQTQKQTRLKELYEKLEKLKLKKQMIEKNSSSDHEMLI